MSSEYSSDKYGTVHLAMSQEDGRLLAVRNLRIPTMDKGDHTGNMHFEAIKNHINTLKGLDHPNVIEYIAFEGTPDQPTIIMEYAPGGSVGGLLRTYGEFEERLAQNILGQILAGVEYLHTKHIVHGEITANHILMCQDGTCKVSDPGFSAVFQLPRVFDSEDVFWMAPEWIEDEALEVGTLQPSADIWGVGCITVAMLTGKRPWQGCESTTVVSRIREKDESPLKSTDVHLSESGTDFLRQCFLREPEDRPNATDLRAHEYAKVS